VLTLRFVYVIVDKLEKAGVKASTILAFPWKRKAPGPQAMGSRRIQKGRNGRFGVSTKTRDQIRVNIPEAVERTMKDRAILREDVENVILHAENSGEKFFNPSTGRFLASFRPGRVTYWVEYSGSDVEFFVHTAYSHRMEAKRGPGS
jgi:hypothetical protein